MSLASALTLPLRLPPASLSLSAAFSPFTSAHPVVPCPIFASAPTSVLLFLRPLTFQEFEVQSKAFQEEVLGFYLRICQMGLFLSLLLNHLFTFSLIQVRQTSFFEYLFLF